jgi:hypothetical protein
MPILGIMASSRLSWEPAGAYDSLATVTVGTAVSTITFAGIPSGYKHLQIRFLARNTGAGVDFDYATIQYNGNTSTASYTYHVLSGNGASASASGGGTGIIGYNVGGYIVAGGVAANRFGVGTIDILDYADTNKNKTTRIFSGWDNNGAGNVALISGLFLSTSAITSIVIGSQTGNLAQYSSFALYGIK